MFVVRVLTPMMVWGCWLLVGYIFSRVVGLVLGIGMLFLGWVADWKFAWIILCYDFLIYT
jgi:hypothetical protein